MGRIHLTVAMDEIDTVRPLVDGAVRPGGIDLTVLTVGDATRHVRMLHNGAADGVERGTGHSGGNGAGCLALRAQHREPVGSRL